MFRKHHPLRCAAILFAAGIAAALPCAALENGETYFPGDVKEDVVTYESGDYVYSVVVRTDNESVRAACIEDYKGTDTDVVIPETIEGMDVVKMGDRAFLENSDITSVTLPKTVQSLGKYTFAECTSLTAFHVAEGSIYFEERDGVLYSEEGTYLVRYPVGTRPEKVTVPDGVYDIGCSAFACCGMLTEITLPDSLTAIGEAAFSLCRHLSSIKLPGGITEIEPYTFFGCENLNDVTLPVNLKTIGNAAFARSGLRGITLPDSLQTIGQCAFAETALSEVTIPPYVSEIGYSAFGYKLNAEGELAMDDKFLIRGYEGTMAQKYAKDTENGNNFTFVAINAETTDTTGAGETTGTVTTTAAPEEGISTGRLIGIIACSIAFLIVLIAGIASIVRGKKKKQAQ